MSARYRNIFIRFREDDPGHMAAWKYIHEMASGNKSNADVVACLVSERNGSGNGDSVPVLGEIKQLCQTTLALLESGVVPNCGKGNGGGEQEEKQQEAEAEVEEGILDFVLDMGD